MDKFDIFVLPFISGLAFIVLYFTIQVIVWIRKMPLEERKKLNEVFKSPKRFTRYLFEVLKESLLHVNLFRTNPLLGFMHMSLAFGWFMLIVLGNLESKVYTHSHLNPPYFPIFLKYFIPDMSQYPLHKAFAFAMDFFLALVLTGVMLAVLKRFFFKRYGIHQKPKLTTADKVGLTALWLIFPLRFLAESAYAGVHQSGGFLTQTAGDFFNNHGVGLTEGYFLWWCYSFSLGAFFFSVPFTRYMHILTEPFYLFVRYAKVDINNIEPIFNDIQSKSCSKCGVCLSACPLAIQGIDRKTQPIYLLDALRKGELTPDMVNSCLNCRRCEEKCPVGLTIEPLRMKLKQNQSAAATPNTEHLSLAEYPKAKIGYFSGCMGKLTPATTSALQSIAKAAGDNLTHLDKDNGICCGRPQKLTGQDQLASELISKNIELFKASGVEIIVTSCPICLKTFRDDYKMQIPIIHHSQYISKLIELRKIGVTKREIKTTYHDPCELSRGLNIRKEPRAVIKSQSDFSELTESAKAQCCGNSLVHSSISSVQKHAIADITISAVPNDANLLITACPACNKAFKHQNNVTVKDIAVFTAENLTKPLHIKEISSIQASKEIKSAN